MLRNYLKIALRNILKHKGFSFINIVGLSLGMACCILIFLWIQDEFSYDGFHKNADNLYRITVHAPTGTDSFSPYALAPLLKKTYPGISKTARFRPINYAVKNGNNTFYEDGALVDADFLEIFSFPFVKGDLQKAFPAKNSLVISEKLARKYFANNDPLGKILTMDNQLKLTVTGVIKNVPANSHLQFDFLAPIQLLGEKTLSSWAWESNGYLLLYPNASPDELRKKIADAILKNDKRSQIKSVVDIQPLKRIHLYALNGTGPIVYIYIFSTIALIVLLIACINFINLSTAKASYRAKEIGIRKALGARRTDIIKQFIGESLLLSIFAMLFAIVLVLIFLPEFNSLASKQLSLDLTGNIRNLLALILITLITGVLASSYNALFMSSFKPVNVLKTSKTTVSRNYMRKILVVTQFALAVILVISTLVVYSQLNYIRDKDLGFDKDNIFIVDVNEQIRKNYDVIKNELSRNPNILNICSASREPLFINDFNMVYWEGKTAEQKVSFYCSRVSLDYFETFNMKMVQGRSFSEKFSRDKTKYIVNETALKYMDLKDAIGKFFSIWNLRGEIIGVVKDFHNNSLHNNMRKVVFRLTPSAYHYYMFFKIKPGNIASTVNSIKETIMKFAPGFPLEFKFLDETFAQQYESEQRTGSLFKYFSFLAIFVACLGLYGLVSYTAEQKTKEIGIRKVHGASVQNIIYMISKEFVKLVILSTVIAFPAAYYAMNRWLQNYAFHTNISIWIFFLSVAIAIIITILTVWYQSYKAAVANPLNSLKYE